MKAHDKMQGKFDAQMTDDMAYSTKDSIFFKEGKKGHILLIYSLDVELVETAEKTVLQKFAGKIFVKPSPDTRYQWLTEKQ